MADTTLETVQVLEVGYQIEEYRGTGLAHSWEDCYTWSETAKEAQDTIEYWTSVDAAQGWVAQYRIVEIQRRVVRLAPAEGSNG